MMPNHRQKRRTQIRFLTESETERFFTNLSDEVTRDLALFQIRTGARVGEAAALTFDQIDFGNKRVRISQHADWARRKGTEHLIVEGTKGGSDREVSVETCMKMLKRRFEKADGKGLVFPGKNGSLLTYRAIQCKFNRACRLAKLGDKKGTHTLRHTFAVDYLRETKDIYALQILLGHSSLKDTLVYGKYQNDAVLKSSDLYNRAMQARTPEPHDIGRQEFKIIAGGRL